MKRRHVIFSMGGKGGVGKTLTMVALAECLKNFKIPLVLLDCDTENKQKGSLCSFFPEAKKVDIRKPEGLDAFIDESCAEGAPLVLADLGAGSGFDAIRWFTEMHDVAKNEGLSFTAIGLVTANPGSVETVFSWGQELQRRVSYVIVRNLHIGPVTLWDESEVAKKFKEEFKPAVITLEARIQDMQTYLENNRLTMEAALKGDQELFRRTSARLRVESMRSRIFGQFSGIMDVLIPEEIDETWASLRTNG